MESGDESPNSIGDPFREGANALLADGSVQYLRKSMPPETLKSLFTINGGEKTGDF
jgi:prepilin-type processing-associated H-X9-DG protein